MTIDREKKFPMFTKQIMKTVDWVDVEVAIPLWEFNIQYLEQQVGMHLNDKARAEERILFFQARIDDIIAEQTKEE